MTDVSMLLGKPSTGEAVTNAVREACVLGAEVVQTAAPRTTVLNSSNVSCTACVPNTAVVPNKMLRVEEAYWWEAAGLCSSTAMAECMSLDGFL